MNCASMQGSKFDVLKLEAPSDSVISLLPRNNRPNVPPTTARSKFIRRAFNCKRIPISSGRDLFFGEPK